jgi:23S rRNA (cytidine1920-2'-O)/16S rRNA (cytidine1409-2'-O)-methyltransferase
MPKNQRVDLALVEQGLFESRAKAQEAIAAGLVTVDGVRVAKTSARVAEGAELVAQAPYPYVSRGGVKLAAALSAFKWLPADEICLDIGAARGGFCDVLLRSGAARVYAIDVGHGQIHPRIAQNARAVVREGLDARNLTAAMFEAVPTFLVCDVSFISLRLVLPAVLALMAPTARLVALIKPQFESAPGRLRKGLVRDSAHHQAVCADISALVENLGWHVIGLIESPIRGGDGNREFLIGATRG